MLEFRTKMGENGRITIPAKCRHLLGFSAGEELLILVENNEARLLSLDQAIKRAQEKVRQYTKGKKNLTDQLIADRRKEAKNE